MNKRSGRLGPAVRLLPVLSLGLGLVITGAIALNGCGEVISRPTAIPPTFTPVLPPDYKTPTPIPPEHRQFFISMGNGGAGDPAITPTLTVSDPAAPAITKADVEQFVMSHPMRGGEVTISDEPGYTITNTQ